MATQHHPPFGHELELFLLGNFMDKTPGGVFSVWGMSGVGKSYLVEHLYYECLTKCFVNGAIGLVKVSRPFDLMDLSWSLLLNLNPGYLQGRLSMKIDPIQECREYLRKYDCVVIIDDVQSTQEWDLTDAALDFRTGRHHVLVSTSEESVAKYCATDSRSVCNVKGLGVDSAFKLVAKKFDDWSQGTKDKFHTLHKCGGLPKVICAVARMVPNEYLFWEFLSKDNLVSALRDEPSLQDLFAWLHSYFRCCPDFLKPCIFYLSIFPLSHIIRRRRLVRRWIAEGYSRESKERSAEKNGEMSFSKLVDLSMVQVPTTTDRSTTNLDHSYYKRMPPLCHVNGFFREYVISKSMEDNLVFALEGHCDKNLHRTGRHLAIDKGWDRDKNVFESIDFTRLRSLTVFGQWESFFISDKMRLLRVLDLENVSSGVTNGSVEQMVKLLPRLRFLSLRGCRQVFRLPDSLGGLWQLQTLDIKDTSVIKLPSSIINLQKLQYIRAGTNNHQQSTEAADQNPAPSATPMSRPCATLGSSCLLNLNRRHRRLDVGSYHSGVKVPRGIGKLLDLHTFGVVDIGATGGCDILEELRKLTQLHKLGVTGINRNNILMFFSAISDLAHLESLSMGVQVDEGDEADWLDDIPSPPVNLQSLKLYGLGCKFPKWINDLKKLRKLSLQMTMLLPGSMDGLNCNSMRELESVRLFLSEFQDDELHFGSANSQEISYFFGLLEISCYSRVHARIIFHDDFLLKVLRIRFWCESSLRFSGLRSLRALEEVWLSSPYDDGLKQHLETELANHHKETFKPVLRLEESGSWIPWLFTSS